MIAMSPVMNAETPETIPASIVSASAGLRVISSNMVLPAGADSYNKFVNDMPINSNTGIAAASPSDHRPNLVFGRTLILTFITSSAHYFKTRDAGSLYIGSNPAAATSLLFSFVEFFGGSPIIASIALKSF
jgi:hypothetical protein